jgi:hypothetical protein
VSGAEGLRTPDLRRAESARYLATNFWGLRNSCKYAYSSHNAFFRLSGHPLGLLHKKGLEQSRYLIPVYRYCCPRERLA